MQMRIKHWDIPPNRRVLVTSDIHGHLTLFRQLLEKGRYAEDDILIIVGDIVEKGPDSLGTLRYIMELCQQRTVWLLAGNVDMWRIQMMESLTEATAQDMYTYLLKMRRWKGTSLFDEMAGELGLSIQSPRDVAAAKAPIIQAFQAEFEFLRSRPTILETQQYIFVHGGLPSQNMEALRDRDAHEVLKFDHFMSTGLCFDKYVVVGHWPVTLYSNRVAQANPIINTEQRIISIDGGCGIKRDGQLNMLVIPNSVCRDADELSFFSCDALSVHEAQTSQEESRTSIHIHWGDNAIRILERGEMRSYVEHVSSGYRLWMENVCIREDSGKTVCEDYTDYRLSVRPGDQLSLIRSTGSDYLVKKDGVTGWYRGQLKTIEGSGKLPSMP